jgi:hypothetical protein
MYGLERRRRLDRAAATARPHPARRRSPSRLNSRPSLVVSNPQPLISRTPGRANCRQLLTPPSRCSRSTSLIFCIASLGCATLRSFLVKKGRRMAVNKGLRRFDQLRALGSGPLMPDTNPACRTAFRSTSEIIRHPIGTLSAISPGVSGMARNAQKPLTYHSRCLLTLFSDTITTITITIWPMLHCAVIARWKR